MATPTPAQAPAACSSFTASAASGGDSTGFQTVTLPAAVRRREGADSSSTAGVLPAAGEGGGSLAADNGSSRDTKVGCVAMPGTPPAREDGSKRGAKLKSKFKQLFLS